MKYIRRKAEDQAAKPPSGDWLNTAQVAEVLMLPVPKARKLLRGPFQRAERTGKGYRVPLEDVDFLLDTMVNRDEDGKDLTGVRCAWAFFAELIGMGNEGNWWTEDGINERRKLAAELAEREIPYDE